MPIGTAPSGLAQRNAAAMESKWRRLVEAFRNTEDPNHAARVAGVDARTAKKAWSEGLSYAYARKPIKQIVAEERAMARAKLGSGRDPTPDEIQAAQNDAIRARADEARMVRVAKANVLSMLLMTSRLVKGGDELAERVKLRLKGLEGDPSRATRLLRDIASMARSSAEAVEAVIALERKLLGEGPKQTGHEPMTEEEARAELAEVSSALDRARDRWSGQAEVAVPEEAGEEPALKGGF